jgi:transcriptional regulator with XRE-family HTH domain
MENKNFSSRLLAIQQYLQINWEQTAREFDTTSSTLSAWRRGKTNPTFFPLAFFVKNHPEFNPSWLLLGEGEMIRTSEKIVTEMNQNTLLDDTPLKKELNKLWGKLQHLENQIENLSAKSEERSKKD